MWHRIDDKDNPPPKDGTELLLYHPDRGMAVWPWWGDEDTAGPWHEVTHWMPLPPPPTEATP